MSITEALLVGHCGFDSGRIIEALKAAGFDSFDSAGSVKEAVEKCLNQKYALVVANRVIEGDDRGGITCVESLKSAESSTDIPVLVLSAYDDTQKEVLEKGAEKGFGKDLLESKEAVEIFSKYIN